MKIGTKIFFVEKIDESKYEIFDAEVIGFANITVEGKFPSSADLNPFVCVKWNHGHSVIRKNQINDPLQNDRSFFSTKKKADEYIIDRLFISHMETV